MTTSGTALPAPELLGVEELEPEPAPALEPVPAGLGPAPPAPEPEPVPALEGVGIAELSPGLLAPP